MRLWLFRFTQSDRTLVSARVAAPDMEEAANVMGEFLGRHMCGVLGLHPEPGTILSFLGEDEAAAAGLLSVVRAA